MVDKMDFKIYMAGLNVNAEKPLTFEEVNLEDLYKKIEDYFDQEQTLLVNKGRIFGKLKGDNRTSLPISIKKIEEDIKNEIEEGLEFKIDGHQKNKDTGDNLLIKGIAKIGCTKNGWLSNGVTESNTSFLNEENAENIKLIAKGLLSYINQIEY